MDLEYIAASLLDAILPRHCVVCGRRLLLHERDLCVYCVADIPLSYQWTMSGGRVFSLFLYSDASAFRRIALSVKYRGNILLGRRMGALAGNYARRLYDVSGFVPDIVVPVPLHCLRRHMRGYNQAEMIARGFCEAFEGSYPVCIPDMLRRIRNTRSQTKVAVERKVANVAGAFVIGKGLYEAERLSVALGRKLCAVIVDDTCTTGATLFEAASVLNATGLVKDIRFVTLAKVRQD